MDTQKYHDMINQNKSSKSKSSCSKTHTPPKQEYKGMTLKQYFGLCNNNISHHQIDEIQDQSRCSSSKSIVQTPTFGLNISQSPILCKNHKIRTETNEQDEIQYMKKSNQIKKKYQQLCPIISPKFPQGFQSKNESKSNKNSKNDNKNDRKRLVSIPSRHQHNKQLIKRSTLTSFYHLNKKNKKILTKLKTQKSKINELKLDQAFLVTKYASKFMLTQKQLIAN